MIKAIYAVGGVPGSGKSTLFRMLVESLTIGYMKVKFGQYRMGKLTENFQNLDPIDGKIWYHVLGTGYLGDSKFPGTDMLSMAVQPDAIQVIKAMEADNQEHYVYFEGDRLFNNSFLSELVDIVDDRLHVLFIGASDSELDRRHNVREDTQTDQFLKSRETKYRNIEMNLSLMGCIERLIHETPNDTVRIIKAIGIN